MQRYFIPPAAINGNQLAITGDDAHHLLKVMRAKLDEQIICCDGSGREALATIIELHKDSVVAEFADWQQSDREPQLHVTIAQSLPKGDKMETIIQKCTEIGAARFVPFVSERTIVQYDNRKEAKRLERWSKIAKEAAEQAHRSIIPIVEQTSSWSELVQSTSHYDLILFCYEKQEGQPLRTVLKERTDSLSKPHASVLLVIGPEGGFTPRESEHARDHGWSTVGLGNRILRTETAAMVGLTCIFYEFGEMGG